MSSPGVYSRCCTNSTECPKNGLLCMPVMKPSTTCRARRSSREMRAMVAGWRKRRGSSSFRRPWMRPGVRFRCVRVDESRSSPTRNVEPELDRRHDAKIFLNRSSAVRSPSLLRRLLEQLLDDRVGGDAFGRGGEVGQDAVPQHRVGQRLDVVGRDVRPAVEQGAGLAAEDQVLHGARAGAPGQPVLDELRHARLADARLPHQGQGVLDDVVGHRHLADQRLQSRGSARRSAPA